MSPDTDSSFIVLDRFVAWGIWIVYFEKNMGLGYTVGHESIRRYW